MSDYEAIARALAFQASRLANKPSPDLIAAHLDLSPAGLQQLLCRWLGAAGRLSCVPTDLPPCVQEIPVCAQPTGLTIVLENRERPRTAVREAQPVIDYVFADTRFGVAFLAATGHGICCLEFPDQAPQDVLRGLAATWPGARLCPNETRLRPLLETVFAGAPIRQPLSLHLRGTPFQTRVWQTLLRIPMGRVASYAQVARAIGCPRGTRAVGQAIGANPVAFLVPCHRVVRTQGGLGGYRWDPIRKRALLVWEDAIAESTRS